MYSGGTKSDGDYPLLSTAIEGGLFHPRCKDSTSTYYEGITTLEPVSAEEMAEMDRHEKLEEQQLYYKNQEKKNKRIADNSLDKDNQRIFQFRADESAKKADEIGEKLTKSIAKSDSSGIINLHTMPNIQLFAKRSEDFETVVLPKHEYAHIMSEISTNLTKEQAKRRVFTKAIGDYLYTVENNGFGNYRVIKKIKIEEDL